MLPSDVSAESLERLTAIATDLAIGGREGKSIGAMFVLGDHLEVIKRSKQLILNPFHGYAEEDRSILNPFMDETIKELALIDGAFIVQGNGVVESAGCLIQGKSDEIELPGGLVQARSCSGITQSTDSLPLWFPAPVRLREFRRGRCLLIESLKDVPVIRQCLHPQIIIHVSDFSEALLIPSSGYVSLA